MYNDIIITKNIYFNKKKVFNGNTETFKYNTKKYF